MPTPGRKKRKTTSLERPVALQYDRDELKYTPHSDILPSSLVRRSYTASCPTLPAWLVFMATDILEEANGGSKFTIWGVTAEKHTVLLRIEDFQQYFYISVPIRQSDGEQDSEWGTNPKELENLAALMNRQIHVPDAHIQRIECVHKIPIMYYRPDAPKGRSFLKIFLTPGNARRTASVVQKAIVDNCCLLTEGLSWNNFELYEGEIAPLQRFLADVPVCGGAWLAIPKGHTQGGRMEVATPEKSQRAPYAGYIEPQHCISNCDIEVIAQSWKTIRCLSPDATQLAIPDWSPFDNVDTPRQLYGALEAAKRGDIAPLRLMILDTVSTTSDGSERTPNPSEGDPIAVISCTLTMSSMGEASSRDDDAIDDVGEEEDGSNAIPAVPLSSAAVAGAPTTHHSTFLKADEATATFVFMLTPDRSSSCIEKYRDPGTGASLLRFCREEELLTRWLDFVRQYDPDMICLFQAADTLDAIRKRIEVLKIEGGQMYLSRALGRQRPTAVKRVTMYSAAWVKSQSRMASTSNQETYKAEIDGRLVIDLLRHVLTGSNLASFTLVDCAQAILSETLEVLRPHQVRLLMSDWKGALRLTRYAVRKVFAVHALLQHLATIPESVEMARATGLTIPQVQYNAQMIRTMSLLMRTAQRQGYILAGRQEQVGLAESPFLMHPVDHNTVGLYHSPVAILDFASLYPSLYRAYNLCYTTLVWPEEVDNFSPDEIFTTPCGAAFVKPNVRAGLLPQILAALITARAETRNQLKSSSDKAARAVLEGRQRALKVTANALYGFTGAQASPLQCAPLADSCLALGHASCKRAKGVLEEAAAAGTLGLGGFGARVIYAQTDSLFVVLPAVKDAAAAIDIGHMAGKVVSQAFPNPIELKFERVCQPFLLLHVNRYAGKAFEKKEDVDKGELIVKGLKSMWRQAAPIVRTTLHGSLVRILMKNDVDGALQFAKGEIYRLLSGNVDMYELIMTGGLWRVSGDQVERAAGGDALSKGEEIRGPHAALAVKIKERDPGRSFVLGERLQYVLLAGRKLQDEAAEDPLVAVRSNAPPDYQLYWTNKLRTPLQELFSPCVSPPQLQNLLHGSHTMIKVEIVQPQPSTGLGPVSPSPHERKKGGRQTGLTRFFKTSFKCLGCKRAIHTQTEMTPGLCSSCAGVQGKWQEVYMNYVEQNTALGKTLCSAQEACMRCHSGVLCGQPVLCENAECPVFYARTGSESRLQSIQTALDRLSMM